MANKPKPRRRPLGDIDPTVADIMRMDHRSTLLDDQDESAFEIEDSLPAPPQLRQPSPVQQQKTGSELTKDQQRIRERRARRATFDLPPVIRGKLAELSINYGVPQSQIVSLLLLHGFEKINSEEIDILSRREKSTSPKFAYNLTLDDLLKQLK